MGAFASQFESRTLLRETQGFASWTLKCCVRLKKAFATQIRGYALIKPQFVGLLQFKKDAMVDVQLESVFQVLDKDGVGRIDGLGLIAGIALCCDATFEEKVKFCFELFDFNMNASLDKNEMIMMMNVSVEGMLLLVGARGDLGLSNDFKRLGDDAFRQCDNDRSGSISYQEFVQWARGNREVMSCMEKLNRIRGEGSSHADGYDSSEEALTDDDEFVSQEKGQAAKQRKRLQKTREEEQRKLAHPGTGSWEGLCVEPASSLFSTSPSSDAPESNLVLDYVHGFRAQDVRSNVFFVDLYDDDAHEQTAQEKAMLKRAGQIGQMGVVYPAATTVVVADLRNMMQDKRKQRFYQGHKGKEVLCLTVGTQRLLVASGEAGEIPAIHVWDAGRLRCLSKIEGFHSRGILHLAFNHRGDHLASIGLDDDYNIAIYNWRTGAIVASGRSHGHSWLCKEKQPLDLAYSNDDEELCVVGHKFINFITIQGRSLKVRPCTFGSSYKRQTFFCCVYVDAAVRSVVVGCASGELLLIDESHRPVRSVQAHSMGEPVLSMCESPDTAGVVTAGADGLIQTWDGSLKRVGSVVDAAEQVSGMDTKKVAIPKIQSVDMMDKYIAVGTRSSDVMVTAISNTNNSNTSLLRHFYSLTHGHYSECGQGELWGLATHPSKPLYVTAGEDRTVRVWNFQNKRVVAFRRLPQPFGAARAIAYHPSGTHVAVGLLGPIVILDSESLKVIVDWQHTTQPIQALTYSPNGKFFAAACQDHNIYIYTVEVDLAAFPDSKQTSEGGGGGGGGGGGSAGAGASGDGAGDKGTGGTTRGLPVRYMRHAVCRGHTGPVGQIDFGRDSDKISSCAVSAINGTPEMKFWNSSGKQIRGLDPLRTVIFEDASATLGFNLRGLVQGTTTLPGSAKHSSVRHIPELMSVHASLEIGTVLTGHADGSLRLYHYPCEDAEAMFKEFNGHSSPVTATRFVMMQTAAISIGRDDRCVMQWRHEFEDLSEGEEAAPDEVHDLFQLIAGSSDRISDIQMLDALTPPDNSLGGSVAETHSVWHRLYKTENQALRKILFLRGAALKQAIKAAFDTFDTDKNNTIDKNEWTVFVDALYREEVDSRCQIEAMILSEEYTSDSWLDTVHAASHYNVLFPEPPHRLQRAQGLTKELPDKNTWLSHVVEPKDFKMNANAFNTPDTDLDMSWVSGYRGSRCRNNIGYAAGGQLVYPAASLGVVYDKSTGKQSFFQGVHTSSVVCLTMHPSGKLAATGELGAEPKTVVWDVDMLNVKVSLAGFHRNGVAHLSFSPNTGEYLATVGLDSDHSIAVYDWEQSRLVASSPGDKSHILGMAFTSTGKDGALQVITHSNKAIKFWSFESHGGLRCQRGIWGQIPRVTIVSAVQACNYLVTGSCDGQLCIWDQHILRSVVSDVQNPHRNNHENYDHRDRTPEWLLMSKAEQEEYMKQKSFVDAKDAGVINSLVSFEADKNSARVVSGDSNGVVVLWACLPASKHLLGGNVQYQMNKRQEKMDSARGYNFRERVHHEAASNYLTVNLVADICLVPLLGFSLAAIDATPYDATPGLNSPGYDTAVRSIAYRQGSLLIGTSRNEIYEVDIDLIKEGLVDQDWIMGYLQDLTKQDAIEKRADPESFMVKRKPRPNMFDVFAKIKDRHPEYKDSDHLFLPPSWRNGDQKMTYDDLVLELHFLMRKVRHGFPCSKTHEGGIQVIDPLHPFEAHKPGREGPKELDRARWENLGTDSAAVSMEHWPITSSFHTHSDAQGDMRRYDSFRFTNSSVGAPGSPNETHVGFGGEGLEEDEFVAGGESINHSYRVEVKLDRRAWDVHWHDGVLIKVEPDESDESANIRSFGGGGWRFVVRIKILTQEDYESVMTEMSLLRSGELSEESYAATPIKVNKMDRATLKPIEVTDTNEEFDFDSYAYTVERTVRRHELRFPGGSMGRHMTPISSPNWIGTVSLRSRVSREEKATCQIDLGELNENESCLGVWITGLRDMGNVAVTCHTSSHTKGEISDVATHPSREEFVTVGDDGLVRIWGYEERTPRFIRNLHQKLRAVDIMPPHPGRSLTKGIGNREEDRIAVGMANGQIVILDGELKLCGRPLMGPTQTIIELKYSPDADRLAASSQDSHIYMWKVKAPTQGPLGTIRRSQLLAKEGIIGRTAQLPSVSRRPFEVVYTPHYEKEFEVGDVVRVVKEGHQKGRVGVVDKLWDKDVTGQHGRLKIKFKRKAEEDSVGGDATEDTVIKAYFSEELVRSEKPNPFIERAVREGEEEEEVEEEEEEGEEEVEQEELTEAGTVTEDGAEETKGYGDEEGEEEEEEEEEDEGFWYPDSDHPEYEREVFVKDHHWEKYGHTAPVTHLVWGRDPLSSPTEATAGRGVGGGVGARSKADPSSPRGSKNAPKRGGREVVHKYLMSADQNLEVRYWREELVESRGGSCDDRTDYRCIRGANERRSIDWYDWEATLGWPVQGMWGDKQRPIAVDRSHTYLSVPVMASGHDDGTVRLYSYPCVTTESAFKSYSGHTSSVLKARFSADDKYLVTIDRSDQCIITWQTDCVEEKRERMAAGATNTNADADALESEGVELLPSDAGDDNEPKDSDGITVLEQKGRSKARKAGTEIMPWMHECREPSHYDEEGAMLDEKGSSSLPSQELVLNQVYGYNAENSYMSENLFYADGGTKIIYNTAAIGVVMDRKTRKQTLNLDHGCSTITCIAVHPPTHLVATGEYGMSSAWDPDEKPRILIWDDNSGSTLLRIRGYHTHGISHMCFTSGGLCLVSIGMDSHNSVAVHHSRTGALLCCGMGDRQRVYDLAVSHHGSDDELSELCTVSDRVFKIYTISKGSGELESKKGIFGKQATCQNIRCCAYLGQDPVTGQSDGSIYLWKNRTCSKVRLKAHASCVQTLSAVQGTRFSDGGKIQYKAEVISGGDDGMVIIWDNNLNVLWSKDMNLAYGASSSGLVDTASAGEAAAEPDDTEDDDWSSGVNVKFGNQRRCTVRSICNVGDEILIGTGEGDILEVDKAGAGGADRPLTRYMDGHCLGEIAALACHPTMQHFATGGDDGRVRIWDALTKQAILPFYCQGRVRALAYSPNGEILAVGLHSGELVVCDVARWMAPAGVDNKLTPTSVQVSSDWIHAVAYSPNGDFVAVGSNDHNIYILNTTAYSQCAILKGHRNHVTHLDWSVDSSFIQSNCGDHDLKFWDARFGKQKQIRPVVAKDRTWSTHSCVYGWPILGVWNTLMEGLPADCNRVPNLTTVDRSTKGQATTVSGDTEKRIRLHKHPAIGKAPAYREYHGHSGAITQIMFTAGSRFVITVGGSDRTIMQYEYDD